MNERALNRRTFWSAVVVIAATYGYFLIFAEFAFLERLHADVGEAGLRPAMGALGAAGMAGSLLAAWRFRLGSYVRTLRWLAFACAVAAGVACVNASAWTAAAVGLALGGLTVTLASGLRAVLGLKKLGLAVGLGTGLAYAACNLPVVFHASPRVQAGAGIVFMLAAMVAARWLKAETAEVAASSDFRPGRAVAWTVVFMALVWLDSAAFYVIQHTPQLREGTWGGSGSLWLNAAVHFSMAVFAGACLDRGWLGRVMFAAWAALALACLLLGDTVRDYAGAELLYTAGVSFYSVALVYYPARGGRPWLAGGVLAVAGWLGSALGIGMVQDLHALPVWLAPAAGVVIAAVLLARWRTRHGLRQPLLVGAGLAAVVIGQREARADEEAALVARGREVFIGEGCIHCHSQYVRSGTADVLRWGPEKPLAESLAEAPPLLGNRRQGPDLAQVGNRRTPEWNRLHLMDPRAISPGSRMPSYAHLFRDGDACGDALVAYLASLGAGTQEVRAARVAAWSPPAAVTADAVAGARLFVRICANCHGSEGRGDGVTAARLSVRPPDWSRDGWRRADASRLDESLARIIKFGLPGSPMAGHEYLRDDEVVSLARYVRSLHGGDHSP